MKFVDCHDKNDPENPKPLINFILSGNSPAGHAWIHKRANSVDRQLEGYAGEFCDDTLEQIDDSYAGTWINAYSLRWRFAEQSVAKN